MLIDRRERFEEIYEAYSGPILTYAIRRTSDVADAADVVGETFVVAWRRIDDVPEGDQARRWLYGVARRALANQRRSTERRQRLHERLANEVAGWRSSSDPEHGASLAPVAAAFAALSADDRELLTLVAWEGLDRAEIASILGCGTAAVRVRIHRARKRLARQLNPASLTRVADAGHDSTRGAAALPGPEEA